MPDAARPLRIIHCFRSPVGGVFRHVRDLAIEQSRAGHQVGILCDSSTGGELEERKFESIMPYLSLGLTRMPIDRSITPRDIAAFWRSYKEIRSLRPDVLHGHSAKGGAMARLAGSILRVNRYRVARLYTPHGGSLHFNPRKWTGWTVLTLERAQEWFTDALVFVCEFERKAYESKVGRIRIRNEVVYNGLDDGDFELVGELPNAVHFLYVGMLRDLKGPDIFIEAFAKTERRLRRPLSAMMIGDGPQRDEYLQMMTRLGLGRRITMLPAMDIKEAFATSQTVVVPSRAEALPYIVLEAIAAGKTVIASDVGGISEILGKDSAALVPAGNSDAMADAMVASLTDADWKRRNMPDRTSFQSRFSARRMADGITGLYRELLAR